MDLVDGLDEATVAERIRLGDVNDVGSAPTRTVVEILRHNVLTRFNALLGGLLAVILFVGDLRDALFGLVLLANTAIGVAQELRAKRTLDRLALLAAPRAHVIRAGEVREVAPNEIVLGDVLELRPGEQVVVDGEVLSSNGAEIDESLLTGEADPVPKRPGDDVLSGSFVAAGSGRYRATRVGAHAYASALTQEARRFTFVRSELRSGIDRILRLVTWGLIPSGALLAASQLRAHAGLREALSASVAGVVAMVPEGLVLLTSAAFAVSAVRLARRQALVQELPAVEALARVDVVCLDKTGTLTEGTVVVDAVEPVVEDAHAAAALGALAAADPNPNATLRAIAVHFPAPPTWRATDTVAFSSARKFSGAAFGQQGTWLIGAPDVLLAGADLDGVGDRVAAHAQQGRRVVLLARSPALPAVDSAPERVEPVALVLLSDRIRPEAPDTLRYFARQGLEVKIISGDDPRTVAAVARRAGLDAAGDGIDARHLPEGGQELAKAVEDGRVFGRVTPRQKQAMVTALQAGGHVVAMTGDGVNDVLALKEADIGVAMGAGSSAARAVSQLVLLTDSFSVLPAVVAEGRRVIDNIERVAKLFCTKSVYAMLLALTVGVAGLPFPFLPRHLSLVAALTIGLPGLFLALAPSNRRAVGGFVPRVLRTAVPAGALAAVGTFAAYAAARVQSDVGSEEAATTATVVLVSIGLLILARVATPLTPARRWLVSAMAGGFVVVLAVPALRAFFALNLPPAITWMGAIGAVAVTERLLRSGPRAGSWLLSGLDRRWPQAADTLRALLEPRGVEVPSGPRVSALLGNAERQRLEHKASLRWDYRQSRVNRDLERAVAKIVAGFANSTTGGTLLLGVDDAGQPLGLDPDYRTLRKPGRDGFELHLTEMLSKYLGAAVLAYVGVTFERVGPHDVGIVTVAPSEHPVFTRDGDDVALHLRTGNSTRPLPVDEAVRYVSSRWRGGPPPAGGPWGRP